MPASAQQLEHRHAGVVASNRLAVDQARAYRQHGKGGGDLRVPVPPVVAIARE
jgi:hypothetical protein